MELRLKLSLCLFLFFLLILMFISSFFESAIIRIKEIDSLDIGKSVCLNATIVHVREFPLNNFQIMILRDSSGEIQAISNSKFSVSNLEGHNFIFFGRISEYNKTLQLIIDKMILP